MIAALFILAGIGLCITKHRGWGTLCFVIALIMVAAMILGVP